MIQRKTKIREKKLLSDRIPAIPNEGQNALSVKNFSYKCAVNEKF